MNELTDKYPSVASLFRKHRGELALLEWAHEQPFVLSDAEELVVELERTSVAGVEKLAIDSSRSLSKFFALVAELRFAALFDRLGAKVEILSDQVFGPGFYAPDLRIKFESGLVLLVDVVWGSPGAAPIDEKLEQRLSGSRLPYLIERALSGELSSPTISRQAREKDEALADKIAKLVHDALEAACDSGKEQGVIHVLAGATSLRSEVEYIERPPYEESFSRKPGWLGTFGFQKSHDGEPLVSGGVNYPHWVNSNEQQSGLERKLKDKASKRKKLPAKYGEVPFVVALENNEPDLSPQAALSFLTGSRHYRRDSGKGSSLTEEVRLLLDTKWNPILKPWDYEGTPNMIMSGYGAFHANRSGWAGELSGVLLAHYGNTKLQWLPNPFARAEVNEPRLLRLPLSLEKLGHPWPSRPGVFGDDADGELAGT